VFDHDVYARFVGDPSDFVTNLLLVVVDDIVGTDLARFLEFALVSGVAITVAWKNLAIWIAALPHRSSRPGPARCVRGGSTHAQSACGRQSGRRVGRWRLR